MTNFDILKRLSNLERSFWQKLDQEEPVTRSSSYNSNYTNADFEDDNEKHVNSNQFDCCGFRVIAA